MLPLIDKPECMRWAREYKYLCNRFMRTPRRDAVLDYARRSFGANGKLNAVDGFMCIDQIVFVDATGKQNSNLSRAASGLAGGGLSMPP
ncbi:MAG: hypothetical protein EPO47_05335 [Rugosibacter sp.]|nr:MAG: hypothetical protein EPO47_05335 [Rugosibacter sp.]